MQSAVSTALETEESAATRLVELVRPGKWLPTSYAGWEGVIDALFDAFLSQFDPSTQRRLLDDQLRLPNSATAAERLVQLASDLTALHKVCQILARHPQVPADARATLTPLERLPPTAIPDEALAAAAALARRIRPELLPDTLHPKIARGSVADVFRFDRAGSRTPTAFKTVRPDALQRIRREAGILTELAGKSPALELLAGSDFARTTSEALRDAALALLRELDFAGEAANLRDAAAFYALNPRVRIPRVEGPPLDEGIFMEFVPGEPLMETPIDPSERRRTARLVFRSLLMEPVFSGLQESIFHADPHAGNIHAQRDRQGKLRLVLLDWSQADRLSAPLRYALVELCLHCFVGKAPPTELLCRLMETRAEIAPIPLSADGDPLHKAFGIIERLATEGHPVPLSLLLLRKSFLTLEGIGHQLDPTFDPWKEMLLYAGWVFASETPFRMLSLPFPWLDAPAFYRSGLTTRTLASQALQMAARL